jgi:pyruvate kinase
MGISRTAGVNSMSHGSYVDLTKFEVQEKHILENLGTMSINDTSHKFKTKIICTLGPVSRDVPKLEDMLRAGMNVARFNFSHGTHEYHQGTLDNLRIASLNTGIRCGVLLDTKGPEIRTGILAGGGPVMLVKDSTVTLTTDYTAKGDATIIGVSYASLAKDVSPGSQILCADGSITFTVLSCDVAAGTVQVRCENSAKLGERKNMNLPGVNVDLPTITEKDRDDLINWGVKNKVDFIAASFVRKGSDLDFIREVLGDAAENIHIISKVENMEGLDNFNDIVEKSDGIMVARGDLGMEIRMEQIFLAQKRMIKRCNEAGKPVVTATQMLESMSGAPRPTRAEATDVANAVLDGTDCVMLSGETAAGDYPVEAIKVMADICAEAEAYVDNYAVFKNLMDHQPIPMSTTESLASSAVRSAHKVDAKLILCLAETGKTARLIAKYRPEAGAYTRPLLSST